MGVVDVATNTIEGIFPLGYKDHSLAGGWQCGTALPGGRALSTVFCVHPCCAQKPHPAFLHVHTIACGA
jgi:hypothetical protein